MAVSIADRANSTEGDTIVVRAATAAFSSVGSAIVFGGEILPDFRLKIVMPGFWRLISRIRVG